MTSRRLIRIKVLQLLYSYMKRDSVTIGEVESNLATSIAKSSELYYQILQLLVDMQRTCYLRIDAARNKRFATKEDLNPNTRFIDNPVLKILTENQQFQSNINARFISWSDDQEIVNHFINKMRESDIFKVYMAKSNVNFEDHKQFVLDLFTEIIVDGDFIFEVLEDKNIFWNDDFALVFGIVYKTIKAIKEEATTETRILFPIFREPDDSEYAKKLLRKTILENEENLALVDQFTPNWEIERICDIDRAILSEAISELKHFPSIPVKVTLDEFIEISKSYSSQKSSSFINGILDNIVALLKERNELVKSGRGLVETSTK